MLEWQQHWGHRGQGGNIGIVPRLLCEQNSWHWFEAADKRELLLCSICCHAHNDDGNISPIDINRGAYSLLIKAFAIAEPHHRKRYSVSAHRTRTKRHSTPRLLSFWWNHDLNQANIIPLVQHPVCNRSLFEFNVMASLSLPPVKGANKKIPLEITFTMRIHCKSSPSLCSIKRRELVNSHQTPFWMTNCHK